MGWEEGKNVLDYSNLPRAVVASSPAWPGLPLLWALPLLKPLTAGAKEKRLLSQQERAETLPIISHPLAFLLVGEDGPSICSFLNAYWDQCTSRPRGEPRNGNIVFQALSSPPGFQKASHGWLPSESPPRISAVLSGFKL